ncbi:MAG: hypothetical protein AAGC47_03710 [Bacteroidota bacterium]
MKNLLFLSSVLFLFSCSSDKSIVSIPAFQSVEIDYSNYQSYQAQIKNRSLSGVDIAVLAKADNQQYRGFGIGSRSTQRVMVEKDAKLVLTNKTGKTVSLSVKPTAMEFPKKPEGMAYISFTLRNNTAKSIPLIIPDVMNPNLSPFSSSGVDLKVGQEILFREKGKSYVLLTVSNQIQAGEKIDVAKLLRERRKELGI